MDGGDIYRASGSLRVASSSGWRNNAMEAFSRSSREEDDEEALRWAALERLPTFDRLKKGILTTSRGGGSEIEVNNLGFNERRKLIERLVNIAEVDNEKFLLKLKNRIDRVGIDLPKIEVRFEHLNVEAEAYVGSRALPTFFNFSINIIEGFLNYLHIISSRKEHLTILNDVSGIIKPSRMTLLLGPPGSGKTTLLLALAGKLDSTLKVSGGVTYNGYGMHEFVPQRTAAYISQHDVHIGEMTVRETLAFSARCQGVGSRYEMLAELSRREKAANIKPDPDIDVFMKATATEGQEANLVTDYILKVNIIALNYLGLEVCADTIVGDEMLRGISGGQRKRVTTGEMLVGPAKALFMDEISTGLDSSTTFQIVNSLRQYVHILNGTALISLLQPAPETYDLFDDIILLSDGQIVYQGPREQVLDFFEDMGFKCPERKGAADFLQEVTSRKDQQQYWARRNEPYRFVTVKEFAEAFQSFHVGRKLGDELGTPFDKKKSHPAALTTKNYGVGKKELLKACISREFLLMKRNSFVYIFKLIQLIIMAMVSMSLFFRTKMHRESVTDGIVYTEVAVWVFLTYYVTGYDPNVGRLFKQYLLLVFVNQMASGLFRLIAATGRNIIVANTFGSFVLLLLFALGGFVLSRDDIKKWWTWAYWCSPLMYGQNAIVVNEFLGHSWDKIVPNSTDTLGVAVLKSRGFFPEAYWYWLGVGALIGFTILFNFGFTLALTYLNPFDKAQMVISEEARSDDDDNRTGGAIQLSTRGSSSGHRSLSGSGDEIRRRSSTSKSSYMTEAATEAIQHNKRGMVLPFEPYSITFDDITYSVDMPPEMKNQGVFDDKLVLLKGVSGAFRPGVLTALMGVSGAAWLRLPPDVNSETRKMFIEEVMELVELKPLRQALVGLPGVNGLSTEQCKRLTIAVELVANPSIIFMDEPTSGLDARAAAIVMRTVRNTVDTGRTVVCTIHQPSIDIFEAFDELMLLKRGGQEIYVGPLGRRSSHVIKYFETTKGVNKINDGYNPATWMLEVTTVAQELALGVDFAEIYKNSDLYRRNKALIKDLSKPTPGSKDLHFDTQYSQSFSTQCIACLWKQHWSYWRNPPYTAVRFLFTTFIALIFGTMFWDLGSKTKKRQDLFNAMGSMYGAVLFLGIQNAGSVQPVVAVERTVFYRERAAGMYSTFPYAVAQVLIEIPYIFAQAVVYGVIVYAMIGFEWTAVKFFWYLFFMFFTLLYFTFYGMMAVAMTPNHHIAQIVSAAFYGIFNLFSGFIVPRTRMPIWWRWYYWACPVSWTLYGLVASQFGDIKDTLDTGETVEEFLRDYFGFKHDFLGVVAAVNVGFTVLFAVIFAVSIKVFNFQNR
ncbi:hypothetical protein LWI29_027037 [Acer saccharum]|uniref:ABC transporter domain-containing protein n=1 Tax=Acer saccharum TaxID=4024 RepID=A0AA39W0I3_ACESA|nr:hypothetical protein LWI29_027037 [Acer saccharum]